jgi:hypothetical protein
MKIIPALIILSILLVSCKKDYTCVCTYTITTDDIYFLNKVETPKSSKATYTYEKINGKEQTIKNQCESKNISYKESNTSLAEGRTGGEKTHETNCSLQ